MLIWGVDLPAGRLPDAVRITLYQELQADQTNAAGSQAIFIVIRFGFEAEVLLMMVGWLYASQIYLSSIS